MELPTLAQVQPSPMTSDDDFPTLLRRKGLLAAVPSAGLIASTGASAHVPTQATTILAFKFKGGVLVAGDRRATAGNTVVYDRADKRCLSCGRGTILRIVQAQRSTFFCPKCQRE